MKACLRLINDLLACPNCDMFQGSRCAQQTSQGRGRGSTYVQDMRATIASMQIRCQTYLPKTLTHCLTQHTVSHSNRLSLTPTGCLSLQHTVSHSNTLSLTPTHCLSLQHTVSHSSPPLQTYKPIPLRACLQALITGVAVLVLLPHCLDHVKAPGWQHYLLTLWRRLQC